MRIVKLLGAVITAAGLSLLLAGCPSNTGPSGVTCTNGHPPHYVNGHYTCINRKGQPFRN